MIFKKCITVSLLLFSLSSYGEIFRTSLTPSRIFIDSAGGDNHLTLTNSSEESLKIIVSVDKKNEDTIKFFPKTFTLKPGNHQIIRLKVSKDFFLNGEQYLFITELEPLQIVNGLKIRPQHGIAIKPLK